MVIADYIIWLNALLKQGKFTQTSLATILNVTHATLNRWVHQKTKPHPRQIEKIKQIFLQYAFYEKLEKEAPLSLWQKKLEAFKKENFLEHLLLQKNWHDHCLLQFTYHTNSIEGSTLTLRDTQTILFDNQVVPRHSLVEHLEVSNHRQAFTKILEAAKEKETLTLNLIFELHQILMSGILTDAGHFRNHPVRIVGTNLIPPNFLKVSEKMEELISQMQVTKDPLGMIMQHAWFEAIHPFSDGNGRIGRLLLNFQLLSQGYPLLVIHTENKSIYYDTLEKAQLQNVYSPLIEFVLKEMESILVPDTLA
ncbi:MAG: hypothetical protein A3G32_05735 [Deltaproteobacteria bacterium RIFCSPLOWO2_12_FULL_40_28]|nr:MAG: hypothetical protein A3C45_03905 [Deltaproteobacteria bacterium RIFCSPHIGHO2_02_FULL_40_28]OGQ18967.1 MAG: hypothetical protein A3E27_09735 [Deltaproteobacteria bacterium RIFCSPHIGHO2_12_FULL_40_32]OGQ39510.1 MAG: hypothetical protein A3I69_09850 [Deltaproteobacteria bacterium RIFCSPLOWO2_02_FULL_40_36]OGQ53400.1 MAG: hypothetical protein A3G32_05735 [Deltaproteobacteria bacterium RIFCSPLOWO2_12_FULL_40_28]